MTEKIWTLEIKTDGKQENRRRKEESSKNGKHKKVKGKKVNTKIKLFVFVFYLQFSAKKCFDRSNVQNQQSTTRIYDSNAERQLKYELFSDILYQV